jgi:hypothetical protein
VVVLTLFILQSALLVVAKIVDDDSSGNYAGINIEVSNFANISPSR